MSVNVEEGKYRNMIAIPRIPHLYIDLYFSLVAIPKYCTYTAVQTWS